jgi:hypothetical protein
MRTWKLTLVLALVVGCGSDDDQPDPQQAQPQAGPVRAQQQVRLSTDPTGLVVRATANGNVVELDGRFESAVIARRNPDGTLTIDCHDDESTAQKALHGAPANPRTLEVQ